MNIKERIYELREEEYAEFHSKLMPTVAPEKVLGVRTPLLRKLAKELAKQATVSLKDKKDLEIFLNKLPHDYYEEDNLHAFLIEMIKDYDECMEEIDRFLPYVDNWATCDSMSPKVFKKNTERLEEKIKIWLAGEQIYTIRFGVKMLMTHFLDSKFDTKYLDMVVSIDSKEYYVNMMIAWYFATALAKQYEATLPYFEQRKLPCWTHNKAIQKAIESYRITPEQKQYLRTLKVK